MRLDQAVHIGMFCIYMGMQCACHRSTKDDGSSHVCIEQTLCVKSNRWRRLALFDSISNHGHSHNCSCDGCENGSGQGAGSGR